MNDKKILQLAPKRFFCPVCGNWHDWEGETLQSYDRKHPYVHKCCNGVKLCFSYNYDSIWVNSSDLCNKIGDAIYDVVHLEDIECDEKENVIRFSIRILTDKIVCSGECDNYCNGCNLPLIGDKRCDDDDEFELELEFKFEFESRYFNKYDQSDREEKLKQKQTFELEQETKRQQELEKPSVTESQHESKKVTKKGKVDTTMANNIFNMNMEFGLNKDKNIASTLMGVAVKNGNSWRIYDKKKKEIIDAGNLQFGNLPIFIMPATRLSEGDLIKEAGEYSYVIETATSDTMIKTMSARTGEVKSAVPINNILGINCYSKVIDISDSINKDDGFDDKRLFIMSSMMTSEDDGSQMNQLLPLMMLFKDKLGGDDDTMKLLLMVSMMGSEDDGGQMNQLLPLIMLFKDKLGGDDDTMKRLFMSSMMGNNMAGSNNPLMGYLMLDTFMGKKDDKAPQQTGDGTAEQGEK